MLRGVRWVAITVAGILLAVLVAITLIKGTGAGQQAAEAMVPAPLATGNALESPKPVPDVRLVDERGRPAPLSSFAGKWVVLAPAMTRCHEVCPMTTGVLMELEAMIRRAGVAKQVVVAEATVDPWRDTPPVLRAYQKMTGAKFKMLTGSVPGMLRLWKHLGILVERVPLEHPDPIDWYTHRPETLNIVHSDGLFILDPAGQVRVIVGGMPQVAGHRLTPALHRLLDAEGVHNLRHPEAPFTARQLMDDVNWALGREVPASSLTPAHAPTLQRAEEEVRGAPHPLASIHAQAGQLLTGSFQALQKRIGGLRGYPVVINEWASWCGPCKAEFPLLASASASFGRNVAFLGFDANDPEEAPAREFLRGHPVSYPSYRGTSNEFATLAPSRYTPTPTTVFVNEAGHVVYVHPGEYENQAELNADIERYALGQHNVVVGHKVGRFATGNRH